MLLGLAAYSRSGPEHQERIERLYAGLPPHRQPFGRPAALLRLLDHATER